MKSRKQPAIRKQMSLLWVALFLQCGIPLAYADYPDLILSSNPTAYYRLEEVSGPTAFDSTANHFDATYVLNGASTSPELALPGIVTNSIAFHGGPDFGSIRIPYQPELSPTTADGQHGAPFSVECWAQANTQPGDYSVVLAMFGPYEASAPYQNASGWNFYQSPGPGSYWIFNMKNGAFAQASAVPIALLDWYHLAATFDGSTVVFYVNGVASVTSGGATTYLADHGADGQVGVGQNVGFLPFNGGIDEIAFYTNVLSAADVLAHYQLGTNSFRVLPTRPGLLQQPESVTNFAGTTATFTAVANGTVPLSYQWNRGSAAIPGAISNTYSFLCSYPADDGATFSVTVTNVVGSTNSDVVTLSVLTNLNILHNPFGPITRNVGSKAAFRVVANGARPISYQWHKIAGAVTTAIPGATNDTLWLSNLQPADDQSQYYAHLTNPFTSTDSEPATLTVQARAVTVPITGYARVVVADDPVAFWRLDEINGSTIAVDAVGSFDGSYDPQAGSFDYEVPTGIPHETNTAVHVTNTALVTIPYTLELNPVTGPWSAEAWLMPTSLDPDNFRTPISSMWNSDFGDHLFGWNIYQHVAGVWTLNMYNGGAGGSFVSDFVHNPLVANTWYYMVVTDDLTTIRLHVNGVQVVALNRAGFGFIPNGINGDRIVAGAPTVLGRRSDNAFGGFDGSIDEVAFYNYALSPAQIQVHYLNSTKLTITKEGTNVILSWSVGTLQSAPAAIGTYTNVSGATSPLTNAASATEEYYRIRVLP
jgi:hypothetical protein